MKIKGKFLMGEGAWGAGLGKQFGVVLHSSATEYF